MTNTVFVHRFDVATLGNAERTPQGFLRIPAYLTRVGVLEYRQVDGQVVRELRPRDEVFAPHSLATLSAAPVTDLHPTRMVGPDNVRELQIGHVGEVVQPEGNMVAAHLTVQDHAAIAKVESGERRELSCGYKCRVDATPGVYEGEPYDQVQRDIVYNHVAIGPKNWGRAGRDVALRIDVADGGDHSVFRLEADDALGVETTDAPEDDAEPDDQDDEAAADTEPDDQDADDDDVAAEQENPTHEELLARIQELEGHTDGLLLEQDPARFLRDETQIAELVAERDALQARVDGLTADLEEARRELAAQQAPVQATDTPQFLQLVHERATLLERARRALPADHKFDGQSTRQVHEAVLKHLGVEFDPAEKADYLRCRFDTATASLGRNASNLDEARRITSPGFVRRPVVRADAREPYVPDWQKPLSYTKDRKKAL